MKADHRGANSSLATKRRLRWHLHLLDRRLLYSGRPVFEAHLKEDGLMARACTPTSLDNIVLTINVLLH